jgi:hypothetical protein
MEITNFLEWSNDSFVTLTSYKSTLAVQDATLDSKVRTGIISHEMLWMRVFRLAKQPYIGGQWTSSLTATVELNNLLRYISVIRRRYFGQLSSYIRIILNHVEDDDALAITPTLLIADLIANGRASVIAAAINAADNLADWYDELGAEFSNLLNIAPEAKGMLYDQGFVAITERALSHMPLLEMRSKLVASYSERQALPYATESIGRGVGAVAANGTIDLFLAYNDITTPATYQGGDASKFFQVSTNGAVGYDAGWKIGAGAAKAGQLASLSVRAVNSSIAFTSDDTVVPAGHIFNALVFPAGAPVTVSLESAPGVSSVTFPDLIAGASLQTATFLLTGTDSIVVSGNANLEFSFTRLANDGTIYIAPEGNQQRVYDGRVEDILGGGNTEVNKKLLNMQYFQELAYALGVHRAAKNDNGLYHLMNAYYHTIWVAGADDLANIDSWKGGQLLSAEFWLGTAKASGVSRPTKLKLWKKFIELAGTMLALFRVDGDVVRFLAE